MVWNCENVCCHLLTVVSAIVNSLGQTQRAVQSCGEGSQVRVYRAGRGYSIELQGCFIAWCPFIKMKSGFFSLPLRESHKQG